MSNNSRPLSLRPLKFSEAVTEILKVKPEPKPAQANAKSPAKTKRRKSRKE